VGASSNCTSLAGTMLDVVPLLLPGMYRKERSMNNIWCLRGSRIVWYALHIGVAADMG